MRLAPWMVHSPGAFCVGSVLKNEALVHDKTIHTRRKRASYVSLLSSFRKADLNSLIFGGR